MHTLLLGLDAFDPVIFERLASEGRLPNLARYTVDGGYARFGVANPPQSEVSWTSIATGKDPGAHGLFDFVHRDRSSHALVVSLLPTRRGLGGVSFVPPFTAKTIFDQTVNKGFPATAMWWPGMFPARRQSPVRTLPGLGTPDLLGRLGVGTLFTTGSTEVPESNKTPLLSLQKLGGDQYSGHFPGPKKGKTGERQAWTQVQIQVTGDESIRLSVGKESWDLRTGAWSPIVEVPFKMGFLVTVIGLTRFIVTQVRPELHLYALPLQIHPLRSPWPYATPPGFVKESWHAGSGFLSLGWPQDTTALEEGHITDDYFLALCNDIFATRERILMHHLGQFKEGLLACVFDTLDRIQHMFWVDRPDVIESWYEKLDGMVGRVEQRLTQLGDKNQVRIVIVSDHGFTAFNHKIHLNRWLLERGLLTAESAHESGKYNQIVWRQTQTYAIGLNSVYLNMADREGQGIVPSEQREALVQQLCVELEQWRGPDGRRVVRKAYRQNEVFTGPYAEFGPDIIVGYAEGYRASQQTGLGGWGAVAVEPNQDHWRGDHCIDPAAVPGVIFAGQGLLGNFPTPSFRDIPALTIDDEIEVGGDASPPSLPDSEDEKVIEERLRSLGYL